MATLTINGKKVTVDDSFLKLSPADQEKTVNEIASQIGVDSGFKSPTEILSGLGNAFTAATLGSQQGATLNAGDEVYSALTAPFRAAYSGLTGKGFDIGKEYADEMKFLQEDRNKTRALNPGAYDFGHLIGSFGMGGAFNKAGMNPVAGATPSALSYATRMGLTGAGYGGVSGFFGSDGDFSQRLIDGLSGAAWGGGTGVLAGGITGAMASTAARRAVPSVSELQDNASKIYDSIRKSMSPAQKVPQSDLNTVVNDINAELIGRGMDRADQPRLTRWLRDMNEKSGMPLVGSEALAMRQRLTGIIEDTAGTSEAALARAALSKLDPVLEKYIPDMATANQLWHAAQNGKEIEMAISRAHSREGAYSQSGFENALRSEFQKLDTKIAVGDLKGISPVEIKIIQEISRGNSPLKIARWVGKLAPTGVVPLMNNSLLALLGMSATGSPLGLAAGAASAGAGMIGRSAATAMASDKANLASVVARNFGQMPTSQPAALRDAIMQGLTYGVASNPRVKEIPQSLMELMGVNPARPIPRQ